MKKFTPVRHGMAAALLGLSAAACVVPGLAIADDNASAAAKADVLRPEILKVLQAAKAEFDAKNINGALVKLAEADAITNKSSYEAFAVERTRADYYTAAGDKAKVAAAFEAVLATNYLQKKSDQLSLELGIGQIYFNDNKYALAVKWLNRYIGDGGPDHRAKEMLTKSYFLNQQYAEALPGITEQIQNDLKAGQVPDEVYFRMQLNAKAALKDEEGQNQAVEQWVSYYPIQKNWDYLVSRIRSQPGFNDHMALDVYRLRLELGLLKTAADYAEMADRSLSAALPGEAKKVLDLGFAAGLMDKGPDAKKYSALLASATKLALEDQNTMQQGEAGAAKAKDGTPLVKLGMAFATAGQFDKGASLIEQGIAKGIATRAEEAHLHLGLAYYWAGRKEDAIKQFQSVQTNDGSSTIARYWIMQINHPLPAGK